MPSSDALGARFEPFIMEQTRQGRQAGALPRRAGPAKDQRPTH